MTPLTATPNHRPHFKAVPVPERPEDLAKDMDLEGRNGHCGFITAISDLENLCLSDMVNVWFQIGRYTE